ESPELESHINYTRINPTKTSHSETRYSIRRYLLRHGPGCRPGNASSIDRYTRTIRSSALVSGCRAPEGRCYRAGPGDYAPPRSPPTPQNDRGDTNRRTIARRCLRRRIGRSRLLEKP